MISNVVLIHGFDESLANIEINGFNIHRLLRNYGYKILRGHIQKHLYPLIHHLSVSLNLGCGPFLVYKSDFHCMHGEL